MRNDFREHVLEHSAKGTTWKNVKYVKKVPLGNGQYKYFYSMAEYSAYTQNRSSGINALSTAKRQGVVNGAKKDFSLDKLYKETGFSVSGKTLAEKQKKMQQNISKGEEKIKEALSKDSSSKKNSSGSSKSSSSGNSKKSKGASSSSGSSSKKSGDSASKEKAASKAASAKSANSQETKKSTKDTTQRAFTQDDLKKLYGIEDKDVNTYEDKEKMLENMQSYKDGSFGYLFSGDNTFRWTKADGEIKIYDADTNKELSIDEYLREAKSIKEFRTDKKKK